MLARSSPISPTITPPAPGEAAERAASSTDGFGSSSLGFEFGVVPLDVPPPTFSNASFGFSGGGGVGMNGFTPETGGGADAATSIFGGSIDGGGAGGC